jgi:putative colanic acid biosysnthesis UDP-glucose lipid carrier transferase
MFAAQDPELRFSNGPIAPTALVRASVDAAVAIGALACAAISFGERFAGPYLILSLLVFSMMFPGGPQHNESDKRGIRNLAMDIVSSWFAVVALLLLLGWATGTFEVFDQRVIVAWVIATPLALFTAHRFVATALPRVLSSEAAQRVAVIAGAGSLGCRLAERMNGQPHLGLRFAGFFDDRGAERLGAEVTPKTLGNLDQLAEYAKRNRVDLIYITLPMASQPRIVKLLEELRDTTASIYFVPDIFLFDLIQARMDTVAGIPVLAVCETPLYGVNGVLKRVSDLILASLILIMIAPLMAAIAIGVKMSSPGPVLFKQRRYGLDGREIVVYKFRSMTVMEDGGVVTQAKKNDARVTPFGGFLRRTSLDELPQFINVLQGRMSVVGPRPHAVSHNEQYRKLIRGYMIRHKVKPGITGWAQVNGFRGETETLDKMKARIEFDLAYLRNWSLRLDLAIVIKTVFVVLKKENAY